jgi:hypothetical protein
MPALLTRALPGSSRNYPCVTNQDKKPLGINEKKHPLKKD